MLSLSNIPGAWFTGESLEWERFIIKLSANVQTASRNFDEIENKHVSVSPPNVCSKITIDSVHEKS